MAREPVRLNVYDMCTMNQYTSRVGVGVFHSGIEVYGTEYGYGGHPYDFTGIFEIEPRDEEALGEENFRFKETIVLGLTDFSDSEIRQLVESIGHLFKGLHYHLLHQNCNHFCDHLAKILCGRGLPNWVNRLAYISTCVPFLERCLPKEFLTPIALEQDIRIHVQQGQAPANVNSEQENHPNCVFVHSTPASASVKSLPEAAGERQSPDAAKSSIFSSFCSPSFKSLNPGKNNSNGEPFKAAAKKTKITSKLSASSNDTESSIVNGEEATNELVNGHHEQNGSRNSTLTHRNSASSISKMPSSQC